MTDTIDIRAISRRTMLLAAGMTEDQCNAARASAGLAPMAPIGKPAATTVQVSKAVANAPSEIDPRALSRASMEREIKKAGKPTDDESALIKTGRR